MQENQRPASPPPQEPDPKQEQAQTALDLWVAALTHSQWKALQIGGGTVLGLAGGVSLFYLDGTATFGSMGLLVAIAIMLLLPGALQRNLSRSIQLGRIVSIVAFALTLLVFFLQVWPK